MKKWDKSWFGIMKGILIPLFGIGVFYLINEYILGTLEIENPLNKGTYESIDISEETRVLFAICLNMIAVEYYRRNKWQYALNSLLITTLILAFVWAFYYNKLSF